MSIPYVKRRQNIDSGVIADNGPASVIPTLASPKQAPTQPRQPHRAKRGPVAAAGAALLLVLVSVMVVDAGDPIPLSFTETFEEDNDCPGGTNCPPSSATYIFVATSINAFVSTAQANTGIRSLYTQMTTPTTGALDFDYLGLSNACITPYKYWVKMTALPNSGQSDQFLWSGKSLVIGNSGAITMGGNVPASPTVGATMITGTWVDFLIYSQFTSGTANCDGTSHGVRTCVISGVLNLNFCSNIYAFSDPSTTDHFDYVSSATTGPLTRQVYFDDMGPLATINPFPVMTQNQASVTNLVGYSMDAGGNNIIVRTNGGNVVSTYNANDLSTVIATVASANCARPDGVLSSLLTDPDTGELNIWTTYFDCAVGGDVQTIRIRNEALGTPVFPNDCEGEATENVANNANIDVPNNMQQMGTLADLAFDFRECINPAGTARGAFASWTFSSSFDGWIGAFAAGYGQNGANIDWELSHEEHATPPLDQSAGAKTIDGFCSWVGPDFKDYIAGVSSNGAAGIYEATRDVSVNSGPGIPATIDFTFIQKFRNTGTYGSSTGVDCAQDKAVFATFGGIRVLQNITDTPSSAPGWPILQAGLTNRPVAITGSGEFIAVASSTGIRIYNINGTQTGFHALPTGTFRGMEFSFSGDKLAVFTSTLITVIESAPATCELEGNCEELGGASDDDPSPTSSPTPTGGSGGGGFGDGENIEDNPYFWVFLWMVVLIVATALLSWGSRAGFGPMVYGIEALAVYVIGMLFYGTDDISPWPVVVIVSVVIGLVIWSRR